MLQEELVTSMRPCKCCWQFVSWRPWCFSSLREKCQIKNPLPDKLQRVRNGSNYPSWISTVYNCTQQFEKLKELFYFSLKIYSLDTCWKTYQCLAWMYKSQN